MKLASKLIGLPVVSFETGKKFEKIEDIIYDDQTNSIVALLVDRGGMFSEAKIIEYSKISSIGDDAIIVVDENVVMTASESELVSRAVGEQVSVRGKQIMTEDGKDLGKVTDLSIDEVSGRVVGYIASGGIFNDLYKGQPYVPAPQAIKVGGDVLFVPSETAQLMEQNVGGLQATMQSIGHKAGEIKDNVVQKTTEFKDAAVEKYDELKTQATSNETKEKVGGFVDNAKDKFSQTVDKIKGSAGEIKDQAQDALVEQRIKGALGKKTNRVVLDEQDNVILDVGEIITHESVEKARSANMLDVLLASVYNKGPDFSNDELKAGEQSIRL